MPLRLPPDEQEPFDGDDAPAAHLDLLHAMAFRAAGTALRLGVFDVLGDEPVPATDLAATLGVDPRGLTVLLDALVGFHYAVRADGGYLVSRAGAWLRLESPYRTVFGFWHRIATELWLDLERSITEGRPPRDFYGWLDDNPDTRAEFQSMLGGMAGAVLPDLVAAVPVPAGGWPVRLLDIGGGHARYAVGLAAEHPALTATVLDLPGTLDAGRELVADEGLADRVEFREADWLRDDLGTGHDIVLLCNVLHCLPPEQAAELLRRAGAALHPGGRVVILEELTDVDPAAGASGAAWVPASSLNLFHTQGGQIYSAADYDGWLTDAGFTDLVRHPVAEAPTFRLLVAVRSDQPVGPVVPTAGQRQMLAFAELNPLSSWHNVPLYAQIAGPLDLAALRTALAGLWARHEALRTGYRGGVAWVAPTGPELDMVDLTGYPAGEWETALGTVRDAALRRPFALADEVPVRVTLLRLDANLHELVLVAHHIAVDGHSLTVLRRDLVDGYHAALADSSADSATATADDERTTFGEYVGWFDEVLRAGTAEDQLSYWRAQLADPPPPLELPIARADASYAAATVPVVLPAALVERVRAVARAERSSPFLLLLTAFGEVLRRYAGTDEVVVGTPVAGRHHPGAADLVGYLVNMVALRLRGADGGSVADALRTARDTALDAFEHSDVPFAEVVDGLSMPRSANTHPLFQVAFAGPPPLGEASTVDGMSFAFDGGTSTESLFDLELQITDNPNGLRGYLKYRSGRFAHEDMTALVDAVLCLTEALVADPAAPLAAAPMLRPAAIDRAVREWNDTAVDYPRDATVVDLVQSWADTTPQATALIYGEVRLTYRELDERADRLAAHLLDLGAAGRIVGVCLGFTVDWAVAMLAVLKAGAAYLPLDPAYPAARLEFMCRDTDTPLVLTHHDLADRFAGIDGVRSVLLDGADGSDAAAIAARPAGRADQPIAPMDPAYVMYTSGSSGRPKGVCVTHRNILRTVCASNYVHIGPEDTVGQAANLSFDAATFELWGALCNGARVVGLRREDVLAPATLAAQLRLNRVDVLFLTTSLARRLAADAPHALASLRCLLFGGESADARMVRQLLAIDGPQLVNGYGPTETTTFALTCGYRPGDEVEAVVPIGRPIANTTAYVLDRELRVVAPGMVGEICVGGDGVALGYLHRPELTEQRFVPDPFADDPGARLYRTGDLGRYRPDGMIEFLGRMDRQVKIRGFRIEPGEVEEALLATGLVGHAAVVVRPDPSGEPSLVGYLVPPDGGRLALDEVRAALAERLPEHLVPAALVELAELPVTENGKLDVAALPEPTAARAGGDAPVQEPRNPVEQAVRDIWRDVLGVPDLGVHDDFFLLGGHSIKASQVMARVRAELDVAVSLRVLFDNPTVASFVAALD